jgi:hypothetical protein
MGTYGGPGDELPMDEDLTKTLTTKFITIVVLVLVLIAIIVLS